MGVKNEDWVQNTRLDVYTRYTSLVNVMIESYVTNECLEKL